MDNSCSILWEIYTSHSAFMVGHGLEGGRMQRVITGHKKQNSGSDNESIQKPYCRGKNLENMQKGSSSIYMTQMLHCVVLACLCSVKDCFLRGGISCPFIDAFNCSWVWNAGTVHNLSVDNRCSLGVRGVVSRSFEEESDKRGEENGEDERASRIKGPTSVHANSAIVISASSLSLKAMLMQNIFYFFYRALEKLQSLW